MMGEETIDQSIEDKQNIEEKTQEVQKGFTVRKKKRTCPDKLLKITYKDVDILAQFLTITGKIRSSKITRVCKKVQKKITREIKIARIMALLPFTDR